MLAPGIGRSLSANARIVLDHFPAHQLGIDPQGLTAPRERRRRSREQYTFAL